ncbi:MAG: CCA tRNA nucleotidyltransferase [Proteobacteria bacterium]|nr:CCA tRNA nucleotidyltransferase [Pseudomonadota bacterium]
MTPTGAITPPAWMTEPATRRVLDALARAGPPARFVGGAVRDAVLGRAVTDIDIATPLPPEAAARALTAAGIKVVPTGIDHGTVTAVMATRHVEITTLRRDVETFGRRARVAYTDDWTEDARRRDFTINALFADADGTLYDPTGDGVADLHAGRVRFIGDPAQRIAEDYLRLLRFFRFHALYGRGAPDARSLAAAAAAAPRLDALSPERIWAELKRLLRAPDPAALVQLMAAHGILPHVLPTPADVEGLARLIQVERGAPPDALRRLAALLAARAAVEPTAARLRLSKAEGKTLAAILGALAMIDQPACRLVRRFGRAAARDAVRLAEARGLAPTAAAAIARALDAWIETPLPVSGDDVLALGVAPGRAVGLLLEQVTAWWEDAGCTADRAACLAQLKRLARASAPGHRAR